MSETLGGRTPDKGPTVVITVIVIARRFLFLISDLVEGGTGVLVLGPQLLRPLVSWEEGPRPNTRSGRKPAGRLFVLSGTQKWPNMFDAEMGDADDASS